MTMKAVKIAELKSRLSWHLREVRRGQVFTVLDRETPIARLVPIASDDDVTITPPASGARPIGKVKLPPPTKLDLDVVGLLLADRRSRG
jgi:antitoxin (DNA-binding transcriptional repressor) of toxin-antitoxin stability system